MPVTKRGFLSQTAWLFNPLGWLAPIVVRAKLIIQTAWLQHLDWDAPLATAEAASWRNLEQVRMPRWFGDGESGQSVEIHGFSDASERAYGAVVYLRVMRGGDPLISPLKRIWLPRLELCAATLLSKLVAWQFAQRANGIGPGLSSCVSLDGLHGDAEMDPRPSGEVVYLRC